PYSMTSRPVSVNSASALVIARLAGAYRRTTATAARSVVRALCYALRTHRSPCCQLVRGPSAGLANLPPLPPFGLGEGRSHHILFQQIDGSREKHHILHQEWNVAGHGGKPAGRRSPAIRHKRNNGDSRNECRNGTEGPKYSCFLVPESE